MFITKNKVRMHDTDMAGILYFPRQFRFAHDALEDFLEKNGIRFFDMFTKNSFVFVIVHAEADYKISLRVGDELVVKMKIGHIGNTSMTFLFEIWRGEELTGTAKTVHVCLDRKTRQKIPVPEEVRKQFAQYT
jgi:1,4-dihydroxy-2-naphthoyl-CoA hydrolase